MLYINHNIDNNFDINTLILILILKNDFQDSVSDFFFFFHSQIINNYVEQLNIFSDCKIFKFTHCFLKILSAEINWKD